MTARALLAAFALMAAPGVASAQTGSIQVAPVLVSMSAERSISSVRVRNGRDRAIALEVDAYAWSQSNGQDVLTPTSDLLVAPGVFEIPAGGEQTVRLGVRAATMGNERAYRIIMRELPGRRENGVALGFSLEMSLPVFVTPRGARSRIDTRFDGERLILTNTGASFAQITLLRGEERVAAPRYLLAGTSAEVQLPARASALRLLAANNSGEQSERMIHVGPADHLASVR